MYLRVPHFLLLRGLLLLLLELFLVGLLLRFELLGVGVIPHGLGGAGYLEVEVHQVLAGALGLGAALQEVGEL